MENIVLSEKIENFLHKPNFMVLGTLKKDGTIQLSPVWFKFEDGLFKISTVKCRAKYHNIKHNEMVAFLIYDLENPYKYIQVDGKAVVLDVTHEEAHNLIDELSSIYLGTSPYPDDLDHQEKRVVISISPLNYTTRGI